MARGKRRPKPMSPKAGIKLFLFVILYLYVKSQG